MEAPVVTVTVAIPDDKSTVFPALDDLKSTIVTPVPMNEPSEPTPICPRPVNDVAVMTPASSSFLTTNKDYWA